VTLVAFVTVTLNVEDEPELIEVGFAVMLTVGADAFTVTVAVAVAVAPAPLAVAV
jgi:hypothetical protein